MASFSFSSVSLAIRNRFGRRFSSDSYNSCSSIAYTERLELIAVFALLQRLQLTNLEYFLVARRAVATVVMQHLRQQLDVVVDGLQLLHAFRLSLRLFNVLKKTMSHE